MALTLHRRAWSRHEPLEQGVCGTKAGPQDRFTTIDGKLTCAECKQYVERTGNGPESLKALLRF